MSDRGTRTWRRATAEDAVALRDLERIASQTGLAHVFGELPYPDDDVLARWALLLDDPEVTVEVVEDERGSGRPRRPRRLPRCATWPSAPTTGAPAWVARASSGPRPPERDGCGCSRPTVGRAGSTSRSAGRPSGASQECPWAPYPTEVEYAAP